MNEINDGIFDNYVHFKAQNFFETPMIEDSAFANRRRCLLPFYECCPYFFLTLDQEVICVHGGLRGSDDLSLNYQPILNDLQLTIQKDKQ